MGITEMGVWFQLWDLKVIFSRTTKFMIGFDLEKIVFRLKGAIEKCVGCFLIYLFLGF